MRTTILFIVIIMLSFYQSAQAQQTDTLSIRQQDIVFIASTTAQGELDSLKISLARGLDNGMTVNEIKEVLVHAYAYCGFPRSLRALQTFMEVLNERNLLTWQERELATVSILSAMGKGVEPMLKSHSAICLRQGITESQLQQMAAIVNGLRKGDDPFALGTLMPDNPNFTDKAWLQGYVAPQDGFGCTVANVTFAPGCRNSWHSHKGGQILLCTSGKGYYQEKGKPIQLLLPGNVVKIAPDVIHWHGAAPDSEFTHIAIGTQLDKGGVTWLEPVTDEEYNSYEEK